MAPEATTEPLASSLPQSLDSLRAVPDVKHYGPDECVSRPRLGLLG